MLDLQGYESSIFDGAIVTLQVALLSLILAVFLGLLGALAKMAPYRWARGIATIYTTVVRGIPDLVLMMLLFFGGQMLLNNGLYATNEWINEWMTTSNPDHEWISYLPDYIEISPFIAGILTIGFIFGAYMAETFRGAIMAVDRGEMEAAKAYGMSQFQTYKRIILPSALRRALPAYSNEVIFMLHGSAIAGIVTLMDLTGAARLVNSRYYAPFESYIAAGLFYMCLTFIIIFVFKQLETRMLRFMRPLS